MLYIYDSYAFLIKNYDPVETLFEYDLSLNAEVNSLLILDTEGNPVSFQLSQDEKKKEYLKWINKPVSIQVKEFGKINGILISFSENEILVLVDGILVKLKSFDWMMKNEKIDPKVFKPQETRKIRVEPSSLPFTVQYLEKGWDWNCKYHIFLNDKNKATIYSKMFINNNSGMEYKGPISVVSGNVKKVYEPEENMEMERAPAVQYLSATPQKSRKVSYVSPEKMEQYQEFAIQGEHHIPTDKTYLLDFIQPFDLTYKMIYSCNLNNSSENLPIVQKIQLLNEKKISFPSGSVYVYNPNGKFIGSNYTSIVKPDDMFELNIGESNFINAKHQLKREVKRFGWFSEQTNIEIQSVFSNANEESITLLAVYPTYHQEVIITKSEISTDGEQFKSMQPKKTNKGIEFTFDLKPLSKIYLSLNMTIKNGF